MIPPSFIPLARLRARAVLAEADRERRFGRAPRLDRTRLVVSAAMLVAVVSVIVAALLLRSILILGGFGAS